MQVQLGYTRKEQGTGVGRVVDNIRTYTKETLLQN